MAAGGGPSRWQSGRGSSPNSNWQQNPTLFNYSGLSGGLSVDALAGPLLFTPTPPINATTTANAPLALGTQHISFGTPHEVHQQISQDSHNSPYPTEFKAAEPKSLPLSEPVVELSNSNVVPSAGYGTLQLQDNIINQFSHSGKQISPPLLSNEGMNAASAMYFDEPNASELQLSSDNTNLKPTDVINGELQNISLSPTASQVTFSDSQSVSANQTANYVPTLETYVNRDIGVQGIPKPPAAIPTQPHVTSTLPPSPSKVSPPQYPFEVPPLSPHWFYLKAGKTWVPFSYRDSKNLEYAWATSSSTLVATDGGRYDVNLTSQTRHSVYWEESPCMVQRCAWFYKGDGESKLVPYDEQTGDILENEYQCVAATSSWNKRIELPDDGYVIIHNANVIVHYKQQDDWTGEDSVQRPRIIRRGISDIKDDIHEGEPEQVDHLVFIVHGIGPVADLKFRTIEECVDDMRQQALSLTGSPHFDKASRMGRVEFLPIKWYGSVHDDKTGVDMQLRSISLSSAAKLRQFTNDTLTDILFFTSPMYCQAISDTVVNEMNRLLNLFRCRNPKFKGQVSVCGHSLGSCILFDILAHQHCKQSKDDGAETEVDSTDLFEEVVEEDERSEEESESNAFNDVDLGTQNGKPDSTNPDTAEIELPDIESVLGKLGLSNLLNKFKEEQIDTDTLILCNDADIKDLGIPMGPRKKLISFIKEQQKKSQASKKQSGDSVKQTQKQTASSVSVGVAVTPKKAKTKGTQTMLSVRKQNQDPNSIEILYYKGITGTGQPCVTYAKLAFEPQHMFALGSPIGLFLTSRGLQSHSIGCEFCLPTCKSFFNIFHPYDPVAYRLEPLIMPNALLAPVLVPHHKGRKRFHLEIKDNISRVSANLKQGFIDAVRSTWTSINEFARAHRTEPTLAEGVSGTRISQGLDAQEVESELCEDTVESFTEKPVAIGKLNNGRRIDYVLQEKPFEIINEYLFALSSHTCYWNSEDTVLLMLREIYGISSHDEQG